jgi:hypothetical protein
MIKRCALLVVAAILFVASVAVADGPSPNACSDAYTRAQILRNDRKLMQARDALRLCSQPTCKDFIVKDCTTWLDQVQTSLPTIVPIATDEAGNNLALVRLTMDGKALADKLDGRSFEVDPGSHSFTFETTDGTPRASQRLVVLVAEGEKNKRVAVALARPGVAATARSPASTPIGPTPSPPSAVALQTTVRHDGAEGRPKWSTKTQPCCTRDEGRPLGSVGRHRLQTTTSCSGKEPGWCASMEKARR